MSSFKLRNIRMSSIVKFLSPAFSFVAFIWIIVAFMAGPLVNILTFEAFVKFVLCLIAGVFLINSITLQFEHSKLIEETNDTLVSLASTIGVLKIIGSSEEYYRELKSSVENSKDSIRLMYLTDKPPHEIGKAAIDYWDWFSHYMKRKDKNISVHRIASLDNIIKNKWLCEDTKKLAADCSYSVKCFFKDGNLPLINVDIVDKREVFLFGPHALTPRWVYIKNPDIGEGMTNYYMKLWDSLKNENLLKDSGTAVSPEEIDKRMQSMTENSNE